MTAIHRRGPGRMTWALGVAVAITALVLSPTGHSGVAFGASLVALWLIFRGATVHDRAHREAGENGHAMWGRGDRYRPKWLAEK